MMYSNCEKSVIETEELTTSCRIMFYHVIRNFKLPDKLRLTQWQFLKFKITLKLAKRHLCESLLQKSVTEKLITEKLHTSADIESKEIQKKKLGSEITVW